MPLVATPAIVLHGFDYLESSRVLRLLTREAGVVSVLARGARRQRRGGMPGADLFAAGEAHISIRPTRELQTLTGFDVTHAHAGIGLALERFAAAAALAELALRYAAGEANPALHDLVAGSLAALATAQPQDAAAVALRAGWSLLATSGFAPALESCAGCHAAIPPGNAAPFDARAGGVLCDRCSRDTTQLRTLPPAARALLASWLAGSPAEPVRFAGDNPTVRAHQRLLREFAREHLHDGRPLRAFEAWEAMFAAGGGAGRYPP